MKTFNVAKIWQQKLSDHKNKVFSDEEMHRILALLLSPDGNKNTKKRILEACAIASYHQMTNIPVVTTFLSNDAPQFRQLTYTIMLFAGFMMEGITKSYIRQYLIIRKR